MEETSAVSNLPEMISAEEVSRILDMRQLIDVVEQGLADLSDKDSGGVVQPVRSVVPVEKHQGLVKTSSISSKQKKM